MCLSTCTRREAARVLGRAAAPARTASTADTGCALTSLLLALGLAGTETPITLGVCWQRNSPSGVCCKAAPEQTTSHRQVLCPEKAPYLGAAKASDGKLFGWRQLQCAEDLLA